MPPTLTTGLRVFPPLTIPGPAQTQVTGLTVVVITIVPVGWAQVKVGTKTDNGKLPHWAFVLMIENSIKVASKILFMLYHLDD